MRQTAAAAHPYASINAKQGGYESGICGSQHTVAGFLNRARSGPIKVRIDIYWIGCGLIVCMLQVILILILILISSGSPRLNKQTIRNTSLRPLSANKRIVCAIGHGCHRRRPGSVGQEGGGFMVANYGIERTDQMGQAVFERRWLCLGALQKRARKSWLGLEGSQAAATIQQVATGLHLATMESP